VASECFDARSSLRYSSSQSDRLHNHLSVSSVLRLLEGCDLRILILIRPRLVFSSSKRPTQPSSLSLRKQCWEMTRYRSELMD
jgi:hypothetical protein